MEGCHVQVWYQVSHGKSVMALCGFGVFDRNGRWFAIGMRVLLIDWTLYPNLRDSASGTITQLVRDDPAITVSLENEGRWLALVIPDQVPGSYLHYEYSVWLEELEPIDG